MYSLGPLTQMHFYDFGRNRVSCYSVPKCMICKTNIHMYNKRMLVPLCTSAQWWHVILFSLGLPSFKVVGFAVLPRCFSTWPQNPMSFRESEHLRLSFLDFGMVVFKHFQLDIILNLNHNLGWGLNPFQFAIVTTYINNIYACVNIYKYVGCYFTLFTGRGGIPY